MSTPQGLPTSLVYDGYSPCPYVTDRVARMPLHCPSRPLTGRELDEHLAAGYRRAGRLIYHTDCPGCRSCQTIRVLVDEFQPNRSQRRAFRKGEQQIRVVQGVCRADAQRAALYAAHKQGRHLDRGEEPISPEEYQAFLGSTCCDSFEMRYYVRDELIGLAVADRGAISVSAVYCYFDPAYSHLSVGTFSILKQIEFCRQAGLKYLYLGFYLEEPCPMNYKALFRPHERWIVDRWVRHD